MSDKDFIDMKEENGQWSAYVSEFSPEKLWEKIKGHAKKVGCEGIRSALRLFYALDNPSMPLKTKMVIYGALGYFISPIDVIPDFIPVVGFTDDIGVLAAAVVMAASYIDAEAKAKADAEAKAEALAIAEKLKACQVKIAAKGGEGGKLFGAITGAAIADALQAQHGLTIDGKKLVLDQPIKSFGSYEVKARLGYEVSGTVYVHVIEEK